MKHERGVVSGAVAVFGVSLFLAAAASADKHCSLQAGYQKGRCKDNGCERIYHVVCKAIRDNLGIAYDCKCPGAAGGRAMGDGANAEIPGGGYMFDGTTLMLGSLVVQDTYDYATGTGDPNDPVVGAMLILPPLTAGGMKHFDDGDFSFDYFSFENTQGGPAVLDMGGNPLMVADFAELAYLPDSQTWGLLLDGGRQYNNFINSPTLQHIQAVDQNDPEAFPGIVLASADDAFGQTNGFTTAHNGPIEASSLGIAVLTACYGDWNADGVVNTLDVLDFLNNWSAGDFAADLNGDGSVDTLDVLGFLNAWGQGCP